MNNADILIKNLLDEKKKGDPCWSGYEQVGMKKKGGRRVPNCIPVDEAVDDMTNAKAILTKYHYEEDPRHDNMQQGTDMWYRHESGHQVFVTVDPTSGFQWHLYQNNSPKSSFHTKEDTSFYRGDGAYSLADMIGTIHGRYGY